MKVSVIIPSHNPRLEYLLRALNALRAQTLSTDSWELVVIDNCSDLPLVKQVDLGWHPRAAIVREDKLGLTSARLRGFSETKGDVLILVDDDNMLAPNYLEVALELAASRPFLGTWGGRIVAEFERPDMAPPPELHALLTLRDVESDLWSNDTGHHASTPWGAGLCIRRVVADTYCSELKQNAARVLLDLRGDRLLYGGDTDITYTGCRLGLGKGVFRDLCLTHLIPAGRCTGAHLCKVSEGRGYSEVLHEHALTGRLPELDRLGFSLFLRRARVLLKPVLERSVAIAYSRGRREAISELSKSGDRE